MYHDLSCDLPQECTDLNDAVGRLDGEAADRGGKAHGNLLRCLARRSGLQPPRRAGRIKLIIWLQVGTRDSGIEGVQDQQPHLRKGLGQLCLFPVRLCDACVCVCAVRGAPRPRPRY